MEWDVKHKAWEQESALHRVNPAQWISLKTGEESINFALLNVF